MGATVLEAVKGSAPRRAPRAVSSLGRSWAPWPLEPVGTKGVPRFRPPLAGRTKGGSGCKGFRGTSASAQGGGCRAGVLRRARAFGDQVRRRPRGVKYHAISTAIAVGQFVQAGLPCFVFAITIPQLDRATDGFGTRRQTIGTVKIVDRFQQQLRQRRDHALVVWVDHRVRMISDIRCVNG
jgi:hypothetical protein